MVKSSCHALVGAHDEMYRIIYGSKSASYMLCKGIVDISQSCFYGKFSELRLMMEVDISFEILPERTLGSKIL